MRLLLLAFLKKLCLDFVQKIARLTPELPLEIFKSSLRRWVVQGFTQRFAKEFLGILQGFSRELIFQDFSRNFHESSQKFLRECFGVSSRVY